MCRSLFLLASVSLFVLLSCVSTVVTPPTFERGTFAEPDGLPIVRPEPVSIVTLGFGPSRIFRINFDQPIDSWPGFHPENWAIRYRDAAWEYSGRSFGVSHVTISTNLGAPEPGPDVLSYFATPPTVKATDTGAEALPFLDFPIGL